MLLCLFVMAISSVVVLGILDQATLHFAVARKTTDYERALYLASAGVHHVLAELEEDPFWTGQVLATELPTGSGYVYSGSVAVGTGGTLVVTGQGTAGSVTRTLQVTVESGA